MIIPQSCANLNRIIIESSNLVAEAVDKSAIALNAANRILHNHTKGGNNVIIRPLTFGERAFLRTALWYTGVWMDVLDSLKGGVAEKADMLGYSLGKHHFIQ